MVMTFILVSSSLTMLLGVRAAKADDSPAAFRWTFITVAGGVIFVLLHIREWGGIIGEGVTLFKNPWGTSLFGAAYFSVTGLELLHVMAGLIALIIVGFVYRPGRYGSPYIDNVGLFCPLHKSLLTLSYAF